MYEVHTGTRPGRPKLLILLCAAALVGALGLAWMQVRESRALGPEVRLGGGPGQPALVVRPPEGWVQLPDDPWTFVRTVEIEGLPEAQFERRITFSYQRWPHVQPLETLLRYRNLSEGVAEAYDREPARIGRLSGVQIRRLRVFQFRNHQETRESMYRLAISPRGDEINIEYHPVRGLTPGELDLLDAIARAVRIDDPLLHRSPSAAMQAAGLSFRPQPTWRTFGPDLEAVPGFYVQGVVGGVPHWSIGVFRTWLAGRRSAADLLIDFALREWQAPDTTPRPERLDIEGREVLLLRRPEGTLGAIAGACAVIEAPDRAALLVLYADDSDAPAAEQAARDLAAGLQFDRSGFPRLGTAGADGAALAIRVRAEFADWWGREPSVVHYRGELVMPPEYRRGVMYLASQRAPAIGQPGAYEGVEQAVRPDLLRETIWRLERGGVGYAWRSTQQPRRAPQQRQMPAALRVSETRSAEGGEVTRVLRRGAAVHERSFAVGSAYVCPPLATMSELLVAQGYPEQAVIEVSNPVGPATMTRLLQPLPPDAEGRRRTLILEDCDPRGSIVVFAEDGEIERQLNPGMLVQRISRDEAVRLQQSLGG